MCSHRYGFQIKIILGTASVAQSWIRGLGGGGREKGKLPDPKGKRESSPGPPGPTKEKPHDLAGPKGKSEKAGQQTF